MCLYPRLIENRKYKANLKNSGVIPAISDKRALYVPVGCGKCMECMKKKAREWQVRLSEEIRTNKNGKFVTLTFDNNAYLYLNKKIKKRIDENGKEWNLTGYDRDNAICKKAVRYFLENWRKEFKRSVKHWFVTEIGGGRYEHIHIHGIIFTDESEETIKRKWKYGFSFIGKYVNEQTINYIVKYIYKTDDKHKNYNPKILTSKGIGKGYLKRVDSKNNKYKGLNTKDFYKTRTGYEIAMPIYYRNKIYTDEERENLWMMKLDKNERYIGGVKVQADNDEDVRNALEVARMKNDDLGYGNDKINWSEKMYENQRRNLLLLQRIKDKKEESNKKREIEPSKENNEIPLGSIDDAF